MSASSVSILGVLYQLNLSNTKTTLIRRLWTSLRSAGDGVLVISMIRAIKPFWSRAKNKSEPSFGSIPQPTAQTNSVQYLFLSWSWRLRGISRTFQSTTQVLNRGDLNIHHKTSMRRFWMPWVMKPSTTLVILSDRWFRRIRCVGLLIVIRRGSKV